MKDFPGGLSLLKVSDRVGYEKDDDNEERHGPRETEARDRGRRRGRRRGGGSSRRRRGPVMSGKESTRTKEAGRKGREWVLSMTRRGTLKTPNGKDLHGVEDDPKHRDDQDMNEWLCARPRPDAYEYDPLVLLRLLLQSVDTSAQKKQWLKEWSSFNIGGTHTHFEDPSRDEADEGVIKGGNGERTGICTICRDFRRGRTRRDSERDEGGQGDRVFRISVNTLSDTVIDDDERECGRRCL
ncbi:hypothetical protein EV361DRAFT_873603 [Lentinula raphanica]|nr:hypothetical protein EV361DRAFT_873603 [Lentinula raphanica]